MEKILIIDDNVDTCELLNAFLARKNYEVATATSGGEGLKKIEKGEYDLVLCDFRLPDYDGLSMIEQIKSISPQTKIVIITGYSDVGLAVKSIKKGAFEYVTKPIIPDEILLTISNALSAKISKAKTQESKSAQPLVNEEFVKGNGENAKQINKLTKLVSPTNMTVMVIGESGTGKEVTAKSIHRQSKRGRHPFVSLDCGALPNELASSELFGYKKGAFTGALNDKKGVFELANKGTLFLDEIGNLNYENQVKLLRVLQERKIKPLGGEKEKKVDVRIVVASNEDLKIKASRGEFREDLYFRLNEFRIDLYPLRERKSDIKEFVEFFLNKANRELGKTVKGVSKEVSTILKDYPFPGNIRELQNIIKRAVLICQGDYLEKEHLPAEICYPQPLSEGVAQVSDNLPLKKVVEQAERKAIIAALLKAKYNKSKAAKLLEIDRKTLYNKIDQYSLD
jgi:two-component system response regulator HydG